MRRGQGLADIFMYFFVLFLLVITIAVTGLPHVFRGQRFTIETASARDVLHGLSIGRSTLALLSLTSYAEYQAFKGQIDPKLHGGELIGVAASSGNKGYEETAPASFKVTPGSISVASDGTVSWNYWSSGIVFSTAPTGNEKAVEVGMSPHDTSPAHQFYIAVPGYWKGAPFAYEAIVSADDLTEVYWDAKS